MLRVRSGASFGIGIASVWVGLVRTVNCGILALKGGIRDIMAIHNGDSALGQVQRIMCDRRDTQMTEKGSTYYDDYSNTNV